MAHRRERLCSASQLWLPHPALCVVPPECFRGLCIWSRAVGSKSGKLRNVVDHDMDRLTKQAHFVPTHKTLNAPRLAQLFIMNIFKLHGFPSSIVSDQGLVFISEFWKALTTQLWVRLNISAAYHPQTNGQTECVNQILEQYLCVYCSYQQDNWVDYLRVAEFQYNNSLHEATRTSPFFTNYGFHPTFSSVPGRIHNPAASNLTSHLNSIRDELRAELELAQESAKRHYDANHSQAPFFRPGEFVMLLCRNIQSSHPSGKLDF